jgi:hypothetical protein
MTPKRKTLADRLEAEINKSLSNKDLKPGDRIKLIEAGVKLVTARHKTEDGGQSGSFFGK